MKPPIIQSVPRRTYCMNSRTIMKQKVIAIAAIVTVVVSIGIRPQGQRACRPVRQWLPAWGAATALRLLYVTNENCNDGGARVATATFAST